MNGQRIFGAGLAAVLAASGTGTLLLSGVSSGGTLFALPLLAIGAVLVAAGHYLLLGLPLSLLVIAYGKVRWWNAMVAGLLIGALPLPLLALGSNADLDALAIMNMAPMFLCLGAAGLAGGIAFRAAYGADEDEVGMA